MSLAVSFDLKVNIKEAEKSIKKWTDGLVQQTGKLGQLGRSSAQVFTESFNSGGGTFGGGFQSGGRSLGKGLGSTLGRAAGLSGGGLGLAMGAGSLAGAGIGAFVDMNMRLAQKTGVFDTASRSLFGNTSALFNQAGTAKSVQDELVESIGASGTTMDPKTINDYAKELMKFRTQENEGKQRVRTLTDNLIQKEAGSLISKTPEAILGDMSNILGNIEKLIGNLGGGRT